MSRLLLIRHGETVGNAARIVQRPDSPLSPRGAAQAERLARRLAGEGIVRIVSSDLARAAATAEHLRRATNAPVAFEPLLQERNFGDLRGTPTPSSGSTRSRRTTRPERRDVAGVPRPSIERGPACKSWPRRPAARWPWSPTASCAAPSSGGISLTGGQTAPESWGNTALTIVEGPAPWRVCLLNCVAHLEELEAGPLV